jgi:hypothetical protein
MSLIYIEDTDGCVVSCVLTEPTAWWILGQANKGIHLTRLFPARHFRFGDSPGLARTASIAPHTPQVNIPS